MRDFKDLDIGTLDRVQYLLERMLELAERSAGDSCPPARRAVLQKGFAFLQAEVLELLNETDEEDT